MKKKLRFIVIAPASADVALVYSDATFINIATSARLAQFHKYPSNNMFNVLDRSFWLSHGWDEVIEV